MMSTRPFGGRHSHTAVRLIRQLIELLGPGAELVRAHEREWASATFSGARHSLLLRLPVIGQAAPVPVVIATLPEHEFDLDRQIVADCTTALQPREQDGSGQWWEPLLVEILTVAAD